MNTTTSQKFSLWLLSTLVMPLITGGILFFSWTSSAMGTPVLLEEGRIIPSVTVLGKGGEPISLSSLKGRVTLVRVVPQLNTPVCDEQTHRFSERNGGLDHVMTFVTLSTNTHTDQQQFAAKANIHNMTFLSDAPGYHFGKHSGLLQEDLNILHRAVLVLDTKGIIRYVDIVPLGRLPDFDQALRASQRLIANVSQEVTP